MVAHLVAAEEQLVWRYLTQSGWLPSIHPSIHRTCVYASLTTGPANHKQPASHRPPDIIPLGPCLYPDTVTLWSKSNIDWLSARAFLCPDSSLVLSHLQRETRRTAWTPARSCFTCNLFIPTASISSRLPISCASFSFQPARPFAPANPGTLRSLNIPSITKDPGPSPGPKQAALSLLNQATSYCIILYAVEPFSQPWSTDFFALFPDSICSSHKH